MVNTVPHLTDHEISLATPTRSFSSLRTPISSRLSQIPMRTVFFISHSTLCLLLDSRISMRRVSMPGNVADSGMRGNRFFRTTSGICDRAQQDLVPGQHILTHHGIRVGGHVHHVPRNRFSGLWLKGQWHQVHQDCASFQHLRSVMLHLLLHLHRQGPRQQVPHRHHLHLF